MSPLMIVHKRISASRFRAWRDCLRRVFADPALSVAHAEWPAEVGRHLCPHGSPQLLLTGALPEGLAATAAWVEVLRRGHPRLRVALATNQRYEANYRAGRAFDYVVNDCGDRRGQPLEAVATAFLASLIKTERV